ncbi:cupin domain-containing protein [Herbaspirillum lusitanum]|uniref:Cupin domain-containing protein n=1 Tax=Herbaspirillum lusitanum TaxID=213312 RepID=A0ABW9A459_9BURK
MSAIRQAPPSFINLRQFAQDSSLGAPIALNEAGGEDAFLSARRVLEVQPGAVMIGAIDLNAGSGMVKAQPADEFIVVCAGELTVTHKDLKLVLQAGQSAIVQHGAGFSWSATQPVTLLFMRYKASTADTCLVVPVSQTPDLQVSNSPSAQLLLTPTPVCRAYSDHLSADEVFACGTWDSTPYSRSANTIAHYELMHLLKGSVSFVDETGRSGTFSQGDIFLIEQGAKCSWESLEHVEKIYAICQA